MKNSNRPCADIVSQLRKSRARLYRMELRARKGRGQNASYTEGKSEGESIGLRFALREIDAVLAQAKSTT